MNPFFYCLALKIFIMLLHSFILIDFCWLNQSNFPLSELYPSWIGILDFRIL